MSTSITIAAAAVTGSLLALKLKQYHPEYSIYIILATGVLLLYYCYDTLAVLVQQILGFASCFQGQEQYIKILTKLIGIAYISEFSADICKDAGYQTLASQVQVLGKLSILAAAVPIFTSLIQTIEEVMV